MFEVKRSKLLRNTSHGVCGIVLTGMAEMPPVTPSLPSHGSRPDAPEGAPYGVGSWPSGLCGGLVCQELVYKPTP